MGILRSFDLNYSVMRELTDFHVEYIGVGKRRIAELRLYNRCPFVVVYDSLEKQKAGQIIDIKILPNQKYNIEINGNNKFTRDSLAFGKRFNRDGI